MSSNFIEPSFAACAIRSLLSSLSARMPSYGARAVKERDSSISILYLIDIEKLSVGLI